MLRGITGNYHSPIFNLDNTVYISISAKIIVYEKKAITHNALSVANSLLKKMY